LGDLFARQASFTVLSKVSKHSVQSRQGMASNSKDRNRWNLCEIWIWSRKFSE